MSEATRPPERFVRLAAAIRLELQKLAQVVAEGREALVDFASTPPPMRELRGIGDILHDFYTGAERIFEKIAPELNGGTPAGAAWHRELLENMTLDLPGIRPPVVSRDTAKVLDEFLRFRHLFRNLYGFELDWEKVRPLLERLPLTWNILERELRAFVSFLETVGSSIRV